MQSVVNKTAIEYIMTDTFILDTYSYVQQLVKIIVIMSYANCTVLPTNDYKVYTPWKNCLLER